MTTEQDTSERDIFEPSDRQLSEVRTNILLGMFDGAKEWSLDQLAEKFEDDLKPSHIEIAGRFGQLIRELQESGDIDQNSSDDQTQPTYTLSEKMRQKVQRIKLIAERTRQLIPSTVDKP